MTGMERARYTLEFKQEAVRLVRGGQSLSSVARGLGVSAQSIDNWVKADAIGGLKEAKGKPVNADQMEIARLRSELAKTRPRNFHCLRGQSAAARIRCDFHVSSSPNRTGSRQWE